MTRFSSRLLVLLLFPFLSVVDLSAQDQRAEDTAESFDAIHSEWKRLDGRLIEIIKAFRAASPAEREKLRITYENVVTQSRNLLPRLRSTAILKYTARPNLDDDVTQTLVGFAANDLRQDKYEEVLNLGSLLLDNGCKEAVVDAFVGTAAWCIDDFALAETHLKKARVTQALTPAAERCLNELPTASEAWATEQQIRAREAAANDLPRVKFVTSKGTMVIELYENEAPQTVGNFVSLVESGFYNGLTFHRVLAGFMAQGGCPDGSGRGGPGYEIFCECSQKNFRKHFRGSLSMAHAGRDSGGSQFFLTFKRTSHLDGKHTVFGRVIEGLEVLAELQRRDPEKALPPEPDRIIKAEVIRKRDHDYRPTKVDGGN